MNGEQCDGCRFWYKKIASECSEGNGTESVCRRYPPSIKLREAEEANSYASPWTLGNDWCGEFQPAKVGQPDKVEGHKTLIRNSSLLVRTINCLAAEGFIYIEDALSEPDDKLIKIPNFCRKNLIDLRQWAVVNQPAKTDQNTATRTLIVKSGLSLRTQKVLLAEELSTVEEVVARKDVDLSKIPNLGRVSLLELRDWERRNQPASKSTT